MQRNLLCLLQEAWRLRSCKSCSLQLEHMAEQGTEEMLAVGKDTALVVDRVLLVSVNILPRVVWPGLLVAWAPAVLVLV